MGVKVSHGATLLPDNARVIPLAGARVRCLVKPRLHEPGVVEFVTDGVTKLRTMDPNLAQSFVAVVRPLHGKNWIHFWYEALVLFDDGKSSMHTFDELEITDTELTRPDRFRVLA